MAGEPADAGDMEATMAPDLVAPMVAFLAHEDCPVTGEIYAAGAGRFAAHLHRLDRGLRRTPRGEPTIEDVAEHWATINDETGYAVPADLTGWSAALHGAPSLTLDQPSPGTSTWMISGAAASHRGICSVAFLKCSDSTWAWPASASR